MFKFVLTTVLAACAFTATSFALPLPTQMALQSRARTAVKPTAHNFEGIVALSNCSGSLVRLEAAKDTDRALILTNGHCLETGFPAPGSFVFGKPSSRGFTLLKADASPAGRVNADLIVYGTMTKTDLALYRLRETYADIQNKFGIRPMSLAKDRPAQGTRLEVISGYWRRGYNCAIDQFVSHLKEEGWTWDDSIRYSRPGCEVIGGTSGSPIIAEGTRVVIGINNTGNEDGEACTRNNPCEIDENGSVSQTQGFTYGQQSYWLYSCLNANNEVDLTVPSCQLPR